MQRGFTLIEVLGALAIGITVAVGVAALISRSLDDTKGQQASLHQAQVTAAAAKYMKQNFDALRSTATATTAVAVTVDQLKTANLLSSSFAATNSYGQSACVLVRQPSAGQLEGLVVGEGGVGPIPAKDIAAVASGSGPGGGYIAEATPLQAVGAFASWSMPSGVLANFASANCGTPMAGGRLANAIFLDGPGSSADFLYRGSVSGHPELNRMTTPLHMAAVAVENDDTDPLCVAGDASSHGRIAVDAAGAVLSCRSGVWKRQGSAFWRDPVADFGSLPIAPDNQLGDVRMVTDLSRAFTWNGGSWLALAVDQDGNMSVPGKLDAGHLQVNLTETRDTPCSPDGLIAKDAFGLLLSCQSGRWQPQSSSQLAYTEVGDVVIMPSAYKTYPAGTVFYSGGFVYDIPGDWVYSTIVRPVNPAKDGLVIVNASSLMDRELAPTSTRRGQFELVVSVVDLDSGATLGSSRAMSPVFVNDTVGISTSLSKVVPKNTNGYEVRIMTGWGTYEGSHAGAFYDRSNYLNAIGQVVEQTPLQTGWTLDLTY